MAERLMADKSIGGKKNFIQRQVPVLSKDYQQLVALLARVVVGRRSFVACAQALRVPLMNAAIWAATNSGC
jgi:hypothetical protein